MSLDGFCMHPLAIELDRELSGGRIDRIFQPNKHTIVLSVRLPGKTVSLHISINPQNPVAGLIGRTIDNPKSPPAFCMALRKHLEGGRIAEVRQSGLDRILHFSADTIGPGGLIVTKTLVAELMGKHSNLILLQEDTIIDAMKKIGSSTSRVRLILPGKPYAPPPHQDKVNLMTAPLADAMARLRADAPTPLAKALVRAFLGVGPVSAKEFCYLAGLPPELAVENLSESDFASLADAIEETTGAFRDRQIAPTVVMDENKKLLAIAAFPLHHLSAHTARTFDAMSEAVDFSTSVSGNYKIPEKDQLKKITNSEIAKLTSKLAVLKEELDEARAADVYKRKADILMTYQYQIEPDPNRAEICLPDIYAEQPEENKIQIALDPRLTIAQNMQAYYRKYNKLKRACESLRLQIAQSEENIKYLSSVDSSLDSSTTLEEIHEIKNELIAAGYIQEIKKNKPTESRSIPHKFAAPDKAEIFVGKNNVQNDRLTFKTARPDDIWLHAKDIPGSHVIIRSEQGAPSAETLHFAAGLAAYFSKSKDSSNVPVDYAPRRHVKKPPKAKPGFVIYANQKTLYVTPDRDEIERLLVEMK